MLEQRLGKRPNLLVLMTDQQRRVRDFPEPWVREHLRSLDRLARTGVSYRRAYINTSPCWSNRATLISGTYPLVNQVLDVGESLDPVQSNFAAMLRAAGYVPTYKGKWHMTAASDQFATSWKTSPVAAQQAAVEDAWMAQLYGFDGWTSPDAGTALVGSTNMTAGNVANLGGGNGANDERVVTGAGMLAPDQEGALAFLERQRDATDPWCLFVSLVNPHDVSVYPSSDPALMTDEEQLQRAGYDLSAFAGYEGFELPASYGADDLSRKPSAQLNFLQGYSGGPMTDDQALNYLKFYAYLTALADDLLGTVLDALTEQQLADTLIVRTADHGEMGAAHGGLREKMNVFYEECVNVPLIFSNPVLFPEPEERDALVGQIDLIPTVGELLGFDPDELRERYMIQGTSVAATLFDETAPTPPEQLFMFYSGKDFTAEMVPDVTDLADGSANIIHGIVGDRWKYAVYYAATNGTALMPPAGGSSGGAATTGAGTPATATPNWVPIVSLPSVQFELYDLDDDPNELRNLLYGSADPGELADDVVDVWQRLHRRLTRLMMENNSMPLGWLEIPYG